MKKSVLLNSSISRVVSQIGHFNTLTIGDAGLPVPNGVEIIDLAIKIGIPPFLNTFEAVTSKSYVQKITMTEEALKNDKKFYNFFIGSCQGKEIQLVQVSHEEIKILTNKSKAIMRTGECKPFANVVLESGVTF